MVIQCRRCVELDLVNCWSDHERFSSGHNFCLSLSSQMSKGWGDIFGGLKTMVGMVGCAKRRSVELFVRAGMG